MIDFKIILWIWRFCQSIKVITPFLPLRSITSTFLTVIHVNMLFFSFWWSPITHTTNPKHLSTALCCNIMWPLKNIQILLPATSLTFIKFVFIANIYWEPAVSETVLTLHRILNKTKKLYAHAIYILDGRGERK